MNTEFADAAHIPVATPRWLSSAEASVGAVVEIATALLVVIEIFVLLAGVTSRYVFQSPLVWTDELGSILFLWLAMLGAVVALRRGEHMRMTALVGKATPSRRAFLETFALVAALAFLLLIPWFALEFAEEEVVVRTPALDISNAWRASALPIGCCLMIIVGVLRLARTATWRRTIGSIVLIAVAAGVLF